MGKCENCGKEASLKNCKIKDDMGTRYRNLCDDCIKAFGVKAKIEVLDVVTQTEEEKIIHNEKIEQLMMTTGPSFDGYRIKEYKGIVFEESISGVGLETKLKGLTDIFASLTGEQMHAINDRINDLKKDLIYQLKSKAVKQGANAIIAVDFESTLPGLSAIMVSASGTAVVIEKIDEA